jgi:hypothetical protein
VCDAFEAMTSDRCYRPARTREAARAELIRESAHQFDPAVIEAFLEVLEQPQPTTIAKPADEEAAWQFAEEVTERYAQLRDQRVNPSADSPLHPAERAHAAGHAPGLPVGLRSAE